MKGELGWEWGKRLVLWKGIASAEKAAGLELPGAWGDGWMVKSTRQLSAPLSPSLHLFCVVQRNKEIPHTAYSHCLLTPARLLAHPPTPSNTPWSPLPILTHSLIHPPESASARTESPHPATSSPLSWKQPSSPLPSPLSLSPPCPSSPSPLPAPSKPASQVRH